MTGSAPVPRLFSADTDIERGATLSACRLYRYSLWRWWNRELPVWLFIMLNPSTADAEKDDLTITKCMGFARRGGAGGIRVVNLYAWRATEPAELKRVHPLDVVGEPGAMINRNNSAIYAAAGDAGRIVAAWGAWGGPLPLRAAQVMDLLPRETIYALALTKDGRPCHPSRLGYDLEPVVYREPRIRSAA